MYCMLPEWYTFIKNQNRMLDISFTIYVFLFLSPLRDICHLGKPSKSSRHPFSLPELNSIFLEINTLFNHQSIH